MKLQIDVFFHQDPAVLRRLDALEASLSGLREDLMALGQQLKDSLTAVLGKEDQALAGIGTLNAEVQDLIGRLKPGDVVTQEMADLATTVGAKIDAINTALAAVPGAPPAGGSPPPGA